MALSIGSHYCVAVHEARVMRTEIWRPLVRAFGVLVMLQPIAGTVFFLQLWEQHRLFGTILLTLAMVAGPVGFGMLTMKPWTRRLLLCWSPLYTASIPFLYIALGETVVTAVVGGTIFGVLFYLSYRVLPGRVRAA